MADSMAMKRAEIGIVGFGPVRVLADFATPDLFMPPSLTSTGDTPIGAAIETGLALLESRKAVYRQSGISYYRPWVFLITDGGPTDSWANASERVKRGEAEKKFMFFAVGVEGANFETLARISVREPLKLSGLRFRDLFRWLSTSMSAVSRSQPGDAVPLANPTAPNGWATTA
jgi:uncharacterized protein YegL